MLPSYPSNPVLPPQNGCFPAYPPLLPTPSIVPGSSPFPVLAMSVIVSGLSLSIRKPLPITDPIHAPSTVDISPMTQPTSSCHDTKTRSGPDRDRKEAILASTATHHLAPSVGPKSLAPPSTALHPLQRIRVVIPRTQTYTLRSMITGHRPKGRPPGRKTRNWLIRSQPSQSSARRGGSQHHIHYGSLSPVGSLKTYVKWLRSMAGAPITSRTFWKPPSQLMFLFHTT